MSLRDLIASRANGSIRRAKGQWPLSRPSLWGLIALPALLLHCSLQHDTPARTGAAALTTFQPGVYTISDTQTFAVDGGFYHWSGDTTERLYTLTTGNTYQQWQFTASGGGFTICNVGDGAGSACLSDGGGTLQIGTSTDVWSVTPSSSGYALQDQRTGLYVSDPSTPGDSAIVPTSSTSSTWSVNPIAGTFLAGTYYISDSSSFAIDGGYYHFSGTTDEELYALTVGNTYQEWEFAASGTGFTICNVGDSPSACLTDGGTSLSIGLGSDVWTVAASGANYTILNQRTGRFISDALTPADGAGVGVSTPGSVWTLTSIALGGSGSDGGSSDAGGDAEGGSGGTGFLASLDCANSSQPALCNYINQTAVAQSKPAGISSQCQSPTNVVPVDPSNFLSVSAGAESGQTLMFAAGTYEGSMQLLSGVTYCGQGTAEFTNSNGFALYGGSISNVVVDGFTLNGGGIKCDSYTSVFVQNSIIENVQGNAVGASIWIPVANNLTIARNKFIDSDNVAMWQVQDSVIADNSFTGISSDYNDAIHLSQCTSACTASGVRFARNAFVEVPRISIEIQNGVSGILVEDNLILFAAGGGSMGISLAIPGSSAPIVRNNWLFGNQATYTTNGGWALELAGNNLTVSGNVMQFWGWGAAVSDNGPSMSLTNNSYCNVGLFLGTDGGFDGYPGINTGNSCVVGAAGYAIPIP
jgi:hypothetical protein